MQIFASGMAVPAAPGDTILAAMKRADASIHHVCGGHGICGTCRVAVDAHWLALLPAPAHSEARLLRILRAGATNHRLACQTVLDASHDGLRFTPDTPPSGSTTPTTSAPTTSPLTSTTLL